MEEVASILRFILACLARSHRAHVGIAQLRAIERHMLLAVAEFRDDRFQLFPDVLFAVAVEQMAEQAAAQVRGAHEPVGDGKWISGKSNEQLYSNLITQYFI